MINTIPSDSHHWEWPQRIITFLQLPFALWGFISSTNCLTVGNFTVQVQYHHSHCAIFVCSRQLFSGKKALKTHCTINTTCSKPEVSEHCGEFSCYRARYFSFECFIHNVYPLSCEEISTRTAGLSKKVFTECPQCKVLSSLKNFLLIFPVSFIIHQFNHSFMKKISGFWAIWSPNETLKGYVL